MCPSYRPHISLLTSACTHLSCTEPKSLACLLIMCIILPQPLLPRALLCILYSPVKIYFFTACPQTYFHLLLKVKVLVPWLCLTLCYPTESSLLGSSVHGILQARILERVSIPFRGSSWPRDRNWVSFIAGGFFTIWATREATSCSNDKVLQCFPAICLHRL